MDTGVPEAFRNIIKPYYKGIHGIILVYDVSYPKSFKNIPNFIKEIEENASPNVLKILVANKCDLPNRIVTEEEGKKLANDFGLPYLETSAKTNKNVNEIFINLSQEIYKANKGNFKKHFQLN